MAGNRLLKSTGIRDSRPFKFRTSKDFTATELEDSSICWDSGMERWWTRHVSAGYDETDPEHICAGGNYAGSPIAESSQGLWLLSLFAGPRTAYVDSKFYIYGNFDISVTIQWKDYPVSASYAYAFLALFAPDTSNLNGARIDYPRRRNNTWFDVFTNGSLSRYSESQYTTYTDNIYITRIKRVGSTYTGYFTNVTDGWSERLIGSEDTGYSGPVFIRLQTSSGSNNYPNAAQDYYNLVINQENVL